MDNQDKKFADAQKEQLQEGIRIQTHTRDEIVRLLLLAQDQIVVTLASQPTDYQTWQLPQLQRDITRVLDQYNTQASAAISSAANSAWAAGIAMVDVPLQAAGVYVMAQAPRIDTQMLEAMRYFMTDRIQNIGKEVINKINQELALVMIGAAHPSDAITATQRLLGDSSRARATTVVRTNIGGAFEIAAQDRRGQAVEFLPGLKKQWRRSSKVHSRLSHDAIDGQIRDVNKPFILFGKNGKVELMHPRDPKAPASEVINCGCVSLSFMESWDVITPGRKAFTRDEIAANPLKFALEPQLIEIGKQAQLAEAFNPHQKRIPKGQKGAGRWASQFPSGVQIHHLSVSAMHATDKNERLSCGIVRGHNAILKSTGYNVFGYERLIDNFGIKHAFNHHGNEKIEAPRGQRAIKASDFTHIEAIVNHPDKIMHSGFSKQSKAPLIRYSKRIGNETYHYTEEIRTGRKTVATNDLWITVHKK